MEFTNEIFFNKPLTVDNTVIITYCGKLYREHSKDISIVYGYGDNWDYTDSSKMIETENGFEVSITLKDYNTFNFCFTNSFNIWDNNFGFNYIAPISPKQQVNENNDTDNLDKSNTTKEETISNEPIVESHINEINDNENNSIEGSNELDDTENNSIEDSNELDDTKIDSSDNSQNFTENDVENAFSDLIDSLLNDTMNSSDSIDISNLSGYGLQSVDEIQEEELINCDEIFNQLFNELTDSPESSPVDNIQIIEDNIINNSSNTEEIASNSIETPSIKHVEAKITDYDKYDVQELDALMDNLLLSISDSYQTSDYATPIQKIEQQDLSQEKVGLPAIPENADWVDKIINFSYNFTKKVTTACKKFGNLIKLKIKNLGIINEK